MRDIAEAVGLLKGSLYHYIRSKEQLLARLFEGSLGDAMVELEAIAAGDASPTERLRDMVRGYVMSVTANLDAVGIYLREWRSLPAPELARVRARRRAMRRLFCVTGRTSGTARVDGSPRPPSRTSSRSARSRAFRASAAESVS